MKRIEREHTRNWENFVTVVTEIIRCNPDSTLCKETTTSPKEALFFALKEFSDVNLNGVFSDCRKSDESQPGLRMLRIKTPRREP